MTIIQPKLYEIAVDCLWLSCLCAERLEAFGVTPVKTDYIIKIIHDWLSITYWNARVDLFCFLELYDIYENLNTDVSPGPCLCHWKLSSCFWVVIPIVLLSLNLSISTLVLKSSFSRSLSLRSYLSLAQAHLLRKFIAWNVIPPCLAVTGSVSIGECWLLGVLWYSYTCLHLRAWMVA